MKEDRTRREAVNRAAWEDNPSPGWDAIKAEDREEAPRGMLEIRDASGAVVDRTAAPTSAGIHRVAWHLRYAPLSAGGGRGGGTGPMVAPGTYTVTAYERSGDETRQLGDPVPFEVVSIIDPALPRQDREEVLAFQFEAGELQQAVRAAAAKVAEALEEVAAMKQLVADGRTVDLAVLDEARRVELRLLDAQERLSGDRTASSRFAPGTPSITSRLQNALFGTLGQSYGPTQTHRRQLEIAEEEFEAARAEIEEVLEVDVPALKRTLDEAGAPWTSGRAIPAGR